MKRARPWLLLLVVALAAVEGWYFLRESPRENAIEGAEPAKRAEAVAPRSEVDAPVDAEGRPRSEATLKEVEAATSASQTAPTTQPPLRVTGRVLDTRGSALADLALALRDSPRKEVARSGPDGRFELELAPTLEQLFGESRHELELSPGQRWTSAIGTPFTSSACTDLLVVAAPAIDLGGIVVDEQGAPVDGAQVWMGVSAQELREFPLQLDRNAELTLSAQTAGGGTFHLVSVPAIANNRLYASHGHARGSVSLPSITTLDLRVVLETEGELDPKPRIEGIVLDHDGRPAAKAVVMLGSSSTKTGEDGRFDLSNPDWSAGGRLFAVKAGFQPAFEDIRERVARLDSSPIVLRLGPEALEIRGTILLEDGKPARGWTIALLDGTELSQHRVPVLLAENLAADQGADAHSPATDSKGEFVLRGLSARAYSLKAWSSKSLLSLEARDVAAGTHDLVLRVPAGATWPEVRGVVVDRRGAPVANVGVEVRLTTYKSGGATSWISGKPASTAADGSFLLKNVPRRDVSLSLGGDSVIDRSIDIGELHPESELRLVAELRCHFRLVCNRGDGKSDEAELLGSAGNPLSIFTFQNGGWGSSSQVRIPDEGATHVLAVSDDAQTVVVTRDGKELARLPIALVPGQVTEVRY